MIAALQRTLCLAWWFLVDGLRSQWCGHADTTWERDGTIRYSRCLSCGLRTQGTDFGPPPVFIQPTRKSLAGKPLLTFKRRA